MVGVAELNTSSDLISGCKPPNYWEMQETEEAIATIDLNTAPGKVLTGNELKIDVWTNQVAEQSVYYEGEDVTIHCLVNKPAYIRLVYVLADGRYTLLHDSTFIDETKVGKPVLIGEFVVLPPFGSEKLIVLAQSTRHVPLNIPERAPIAS